jgi:hypothetical protein
MKIRIATFALVLAIGACATDEATEVTEGTTVSALGIPPTGGTSNRFYWEAYEWAPYIYKGCPDPGPEPWAENATLMPRRGTSVLELELGTAVALDVRAIALPRGVSFKPNARGGTISVGDPHVGDPLGITLKVTHGDCSYELGAEIAYQ